MMQPYFFPYLGYFDLINRSDVWVVFDTAQYIRHGWMNRNRILRPDVGWQYVIAPLRKHARATPLNAVETQPYDQWAPHLLGQLQHYRRRAPGFACAFGLVEECLAAKETNLARLNLLILRKTCAVLGLPFQPSVYSEMKLKLDHVVGPGDWALRVAESLGAEEYLNPPGGAALFDPAAFSRSGIRLKIQEPFVFEYGCRGYVFEPGLSVIDALMWNSPEMIRAHLDRIKAGAEPLVPTVAGVP